MSRATQTALGRDLVQFFEDYLPAQRGLSPHTIRSYRDALVKFYGEERGRKVRYAQAFEVCEYGRQPSRDELKQLFPF